MNLDFINNGFCLRLAITLAHFLWQATAVAVLAAFAGLGLRKSAPAVRYGVFLAALAIMAICPLATFPLVQPPSHELAMPQSPPRVPAAAEAPPPVDIMPIASPDAAPASGLLPRPAAPAPKPVLSADAPPQAPAPALPGVDYWKKLSPIAAGCYLLGVLLMLARLLVGLHGGRRLRRASEPVTDSALLTMLAGQAKSLGLRFMPAVACCRQVAVPVVVGVLRPMILLPISVASGLSAGQIEAILTHELAHIRRCDPLVNLLQRLVETFLFYHPAVWYVSKRIRLERENCCDDLAVAAGTEPYAYAQSLLHLAQRSLAEARHRRYRPAVAIGATDRPSQLRTRIRRLLEGPEESVRLARTWPVAVLLLAATATIITIVSCSPGQREGSQRAATQPADWHLVAKNAMASVQVQKALYDQGPNSHFFIRVRVTNISDRPIGINLGDPQKVIYPNQWGDLVKPQRDVINESRQVFSPMTADQEAQLVQDFKAGKLVRLAKGKSVDYYRDFNNSTGGRPLGAMYTCISLDGQLEMTDGTTAARVTCERFSTDKGKALEGVVDTDLYLPPSFEWGKIPDGALVFTDNEVTGTPTTHAATQPTANASQLAKDYSQKIARVLPKGWSVSAEKDVVTVSREQRVEWYNMVSLPTQNKADLKAMGLIQSSAYTISLVFFPPMTAEEVQRLEKDNERITSEYYTAHPVSPRDKLDGLPKEVRDRLHRVPNILMADCSVALSPFIQGPSQAFYDDTVKAECVAMEQRVRDVLIPATHPATAPDTQATTQAAGNDAIAWGQVVDGLQAGLRVENDGRAFRIGESFNIAFVVRNVGNGSVSLEYGREYGPGEIPAPYGLQVLNSRGQHVYCHFAGLFRGSRIYRVALDPGKALTLYSNKLVIWPISMEGRPQPGTLLVEPGRLTLSQMDTSYSHYSPSGVRSSGGLTTGRIELEILPPRPDDPIAKALQGQPPPAYKASAADVAAALSIMAETTEMKQTPSPQGFYYDTAAFPAIERQCKSLSQGEMNFLEHVATGHPEESSRKTAVQLLGLSGQAGAVDSLVKALDDNSAEVRAATARALEGFRTQDVIKRVLKVLQGDKDWNVRASAAYALGHLGSRTVTADLVEALKSEKDPHALEAIFTALSWLKDPSVIPALRELGAHNADAKFQEYIGRTIRNINDPRFEGTATQPAASAAEIDRLIKRPATSE